MAVKLCPNCGTEVPVDNKFCGNCGGKIDGPSASASAAPVAKTMFFGANQVPGLEKPQHIFYVHVQAALCEARRPQDDHNDGADAAHCAGVASPHQSLCEQANARSDSRQHNDRYASQHPARREGISRPIPRSLKSVDRAPGRAKGPTKLGWLLSIAAQYRSSRRA